MLVMNNGGPAAILQMLQPFDGHQHFRQGEMLKLVAPMVAKRFDSAIVMPNTVPPITSRKLLERYVDEIYELVPEFHPIMTMYLTDTLNPHEVHEALNSEDVMVGGVKYYPRGLTTNSDSGVADPSSLWTPGTNAYQVLKVLAQSRGVLLLHAADGFDKNGIELDPYDQEKHFIENTLPRIIEAHPNLKISVEHLSTRWGVEFMLQNGGERLGCSLTQHHLTKDRRDVFRSGFRPHLMWWPIIQPTEHKLALQELAVADKPFVWLGTDSAPHPVGKKEATCCIGGVLTAHIGIEGYVEAFEEMGALDERFERFASINGPRFYGLLPSSETITLVREGWKVEQPFRCYKPSEEIHPLGRTWDEVVPFRLGETIRWKLAD